MKNKCNCLCHILPSSSNKINQCNCCIFCPHCWEALVINHKTLDYRKECICEYGIDWSEQAFGNYHDYIVNNRLKQKGSKKK